MHLSDCPSKPLLFSGYGLNSVSLSVHFELLVQAVKLLPQYVEKHSTKNSRAARNVVASLLWVGGCRSSDFIFQYGNCYGWCEGGHAEAWCDRWGFWLGTVTCDAQRSVVGIYSFSNSHSELDVACPPSHHPRSVIVSTMNQSHKLCQTQLTTSSNFC